MKFCIGPVMGLVLACMMLQQSAVYARSSKARRSLLDDGASAEAYAVGATSASASSFASSVGGKEYATTQSSADGKSAMVSGVSRAEGQVDVCVKGGKYNAVECRTLAPKKRSSVCSDVPPDDRYTCQEQAEWEKCDEPFIFVGSWCLESCGRCGDGCFDKVPEGQDKCNPDLCDTDYASKPYCLKTCKRCYPGN